MLAHLICMVKDHALCLSGLVPVHSDALACLDDLKGLSRHSSHDDGGKDGPEPVFGGELKALVAGDDKPVPARDDVACTLREL